MRWKKYKKIYSDLDTLMNTGLFHWMVVEILVTLVMPYPSLYDKVYFEEANEKSAGIPF